MLPELPRLGRSIRITLPFVLTRLPRLVVSRSAPLFPYSGITVVPPLLAGPFSQELLCT